MQTGTMHRTQRLAGNIRNSAQTGVAASGQLETNDRIIARITDGIYREPWSAFRELVSNAYDADATKVSIDCDYPFFSVIRVSDDGVGMDSHTVANLLTNIGGSSKRTRRGKILGTVNTNDPTKSPSGRKLIGKIGIGLFAVAQLTNHFQIITKRAGSHERVSATVKINTFQENTLTEKDEEDYVSGSFKVISEHDADLDAHGTTIVLLDVRNAVRQKLQSKEIWDALDSQEQDTSQGQFDIVTKPSFHIGRVGSSGNMDCAPSLPWSDLESSKEKFSSFFGETIKLTKSSSERADLSHLDNYLKMIWRLSLGSPVSYLDEHPFDNADGGKFEYFALSNRPKGSAQPVEFGVGETLRSKLGLQAGTKDPLAKFSVLIDGLELFRPIRLPGELIGSRALPKPLLFIGKVETNFGGASGERSGGRLVFEAYLYWNSKIVPKESIGALLRVNGASGTLFDPDFLGYQIAEQTRKKQVTCEVFVLEGLDGALNIDRESYNTSHPHYLYIQKWLHSAFRQFATQHKRIGTGVRNKQRMEMQAEADSKLSAHTEEVWERMRGGPVAV